MTSEIPIFLTYIYIVGGGGEKEGGRLMPSTGNCEKLVIYHDRTVPLMNECCSLKGLVWPGTWLNCWT